MSHSIWLSNTFCLDEYPNNNGCEFTNELNIPLDFDAPNEQWCVAASEVIYEPDFWKNIRKPFNKVEITIANFESYKMVEDAYVHALRIDIQPLDGFPTRDDVQFPIRI